jgi:hypothetical protein
MEQAVGQLHVGALHVCRPLLELPLVAPAGAQQSPLVTTDCRDAMYALCMPLPAAS